MFKDLMDSDINCNSRTNIDIKLIISQEINRIYQFDHKLAEEIEKLIYSHNLYFNSGLTNEAALGKLNKSYSFRCATCKESITLYPNLPYRDVNDIKYKWEDFLSCNDQIIESIIV